MKFKPAEWLTCSEFVGPSPYFLCCPDGFYAWVAGEAAAVKSIREILLKENRLDCGSVNLMGCWRQGKVLD